MFKNKKSLMLETLVRVTIVVAIFLLIVFPACNKISEIFYGEKDIELFDEFIDSINELKEGQRPVFLRLKEKNQGVVGFSKDSTGFQSIRTGLRTVEHGQKVIVSEFKKPNIIECSDTACICFCSGDFEADGRTISCEIVNCRKMENVDIVGSNLILINPYIDAQQGYFRYWKNGFLFGRSLKFFYNGLPEENAERTVKIIEKRKIGDKLFLGVCDPKIYEDIKGTKNYRQEYFGSRCIVTGYEEGKKFEKLAQNPIYVSPNGLESTLDKVLLYKNAIKKYEEFIKKYESGQEVEDAMYRMVRIYKEELKDNEKSREICIGFIEKYPDSEIKYKCQVMLADISGESMARD